MRRMVAASVATVAVTAALAVSAPGAWAQGAQVVFTTHGPLVADDTNATSDVYLHRLR